MKNFCQKIVAPFIVTLTVLNFVVLAISASHPILVTLFMFLNIGCALVIILIGAFVLSKLVLRKMGRKPVQLRWKTLLAHLHMFKREKKVSNTSIIPVAQLELLRKNVQRLGLALHGMTPEMETARRMHFQKYNEQLPSLVLPPQNAVLFAEYDSLVKMLNHFGFPSLESVRLQQKEFAFFQQWGSDLEARLKQQQHHALKQQSALRFALATMAQQHKTLGEKNSLAQTHSGYQRIQGALRFLEKMVDDHRCQWDLAHTYVQKLQSDMHALTQQFEQTVA